MPDSPPKKELQKQVAEAIREDECGCEEPCVDQPRYEHIARIAIEVCQKHYLAEIERLRQVLREVAELSERGIPSGAAARDVALIARAALKEPSE